ncbi:MAG: hypothetical protein R3A11_02035 [Bdellovibrionota bacterium]
MNRLVLLKMALLSAFVATELHAQSTWIQKGTNQLGPASISQMGGSVQINSSGDRFVSTLPSPLASGAKVFEWNGSAWNQKGSDLGAGPQANTFGFSSDIDAIGNTVILGDYSGKSDLGFARVFEWNSSISNWQQKGADIDGEAAYDFAGFSVSINASGDVIAVGFPSNDTAAVDAGCVKIFQWNGSAWIQKGGTFYGQASQDLAGSAVSIDETGDVIAYGAMGATGNVGRVRVFAWNGATWIQRGQNIDGVSIGGNWGNALDLNANGTTFISASPNVGSFAGLARVYEWDASSNLWQTKGDRFWVRWRMDSWALEEGVSINASGNRIAVGEPSYAPSNNQLGRVQVFEWDGTDWFLLGAAIDGPSNYSYFGRSVSLNTLGDHVASGGPWHETSPGVYPGVAQVFGCRWLLERRKRL